MKQIWIIRILGMSFFGLFASSETVIDCSNEE